MAHRLGERLMAAGLITGEAIHKALAHQKITGHRLGDSLVEIGALDEAALLKFLAAELHTRFVTSDKLERLKVAPEVLDLVPVRMAELESVLPLSVDRDQRVLRVVMAEPQNEGLIQEIAFLAEMKNVEAFIGLRSSIAAAIRKIYYADPTAFARNPGAVPIPHAEATAGGAKPGSQTGAMREALGLRGGFADSDFAETLNVLVGLLEGSSGTEAHSAQLVRYSSEVARRMGVPPREVSNVVIAAYLHNVGKGESHHTVATLALDAQRREQAKVLLQKPLRLFESVHLPSQVNRILAQVYEAYDGSGIPQGAKGQEIAVGARILAAVDSYLDLTRNLAHAWPRTLNKAEALARLGEASGKLFDPEVLLHLAELLGGGLLRRQVLNEGRQLLIAEPEASVRTPLADALTQRNLVVATTAVLDGAGASVLAGEAEALVVSLRFGTSEISTLLSYLRAQPETAGAPVLVLGEPPEAQSRERLLSQGAHLIPMPFEVEHAARLVAEVYDRRLSHGAPGRLVRGTFDELSARSLLELLGSAQKSGRLVVRTPTIEGSLQLERGVVVESTLPGELESAMVTLMQSAAGEFTYEPETLLLGVPKVQRHATELAQLVT